MIQCIRRIMITNTGKGILAKYLIGQASSYASHIAIGCGATPLSSISGEDYSNNTEMDFEMFRVPIISRGYVTEGGVSNIVLTAELPTSDRYEISEIGLYSAAANPSATVYDSRVLYSFSTNENWEYHKANTTAKAVTKIFRSLDAGDNAILVTDPDSPAEALNVFQADADNTTFLSPDRVNRYERGRFINNSIMINGEDATISSLDGELTQDSGNHIHLNNISLNLDGNASTDKLKVAFSVVNRVGADPATNYSTEGIDVPYEVRLLIEFVSSEKTSTNIQSAKMSITLTDGDNADFENNRYYVAESELGDLIKTSAFSWSSVQTVKISAMVSDSESDANDDIGSDKYYVSLDGIRLENVTAINPLYGLTGYTVLQNQNAETVVKPKNTTNFVEFRFAFGNDPV